MTSFLQQVSDHYYDPQKLKDYCFIFPNRRSLAFFTKCLSERSVKNSSVCISPMLYTMNDFFYELSGLSPCDKVHQLLSLYDIYKNLYPKAESLDEFIFWGDILLADFNDVDKYLVEPKSLFTNIKDYRDLQDSFDYLEPQQIEALKSFLSHFTTGGEYKEAFVKIWNILLPLYEQFNESLKSKGLAYEGAVYRGLAQRLKNESIVDILKNKTCKKYIFVGLNALNECEKLLLSKLRDAGLAEFCWDYSSEWIKDKENKSSLFLSQNIVLFPQAFSLDNQGLGTPIINVLSVPSSIAQAKQLPQILQSLGSTGIETAIVLPDENLLLPVLNSIPEDISKVNVTMGYNMKSSALFTLMSDIAALQIHIRTKEGSCLFYHKQVWSIFSNSIIKNILNDQERELVKKIKNDTKFFISETELGQTTLLKLIFRQSITDISQASSDQIENIILYQKSIINYIAKSLSSYPEMSMEIDFAKHFYLVLERMRGYKLNILPKTYYRLLNQLLVGISVPFKGEPLEGLQIMGPLETRGLDFENVVILSVNEDLFPRKSVVASFVPPELRKGFGLPTYEYQDAVWAYYFYRLIQRAKTVWLLYDSRTEALRGGEESRYIKQLRYHFQVPINQYVAKADIKLGESDNTIVKTAEHIEKLKAGSLSASSLQSYLGCKAALYYEKILGLKAPKEVKDNLDGAQSGTALHETLRSLYNYPQVTKEMLEGYLKSKAIEDEVEKQILLQLKTIDLSGKNLISKDLISRYARSIIKRDIEYLEKNGARSFNIIGLEKFCEIIINDFKFVGYIDRLDSIKPGVIRVIDYKTGNGDIKFDINSLSEFGIADKVFGDNSEERPKPVLQLFLYEKMASKYYKDCSFEVSIYHPRKLYREAIETTILSQNFKEEMNAGLVKVLEELGDVNVNFERCEVGDSYHNNCKYCDFKTICGR